MLLSISREELESLGYKHSGIGWADGLICREHFVTVYGQRDHNVPEEQQTINYLNSLFPEVL